jgi:hypothetical protein
MIERRYYEVGNVNDEYGIKKDVLLLLDELEYFDSRIKKFLGPNKVKSAGVDAKRSCRNIEKKINKIKKKIQMTKQDYESDYDDY